MKKLSLILILILTFVYCSKKDFPEDPLQDPCLDYFDHVYRYPPVSWKDSADTEDSGPRTIEAWKIPGDYLKCCSTDSLIRTCLNYPNFIVIWAYNSLQEGFDHIRQECNGFQELYSREDLSMKLINVYLAMDPGGFDPEADPKVIVSLAMIFTNIEMTIAQYDFLKKLSKDEIIILFEDCINKYEIKSSIPNYGHLGEMSLLAIMARIMYIDNYKPFTDGIGTVSGLYDLIESARYLEDEQTIDFIVMNSRNYLIELRK